MSLKQLAVAAAGGVAILGVGYFLTRKGFTGLRTLRDEPERVLTEEEEQALFLYEHGIEGGIDALESGALARINLSNRQLAPDDVRILSNILRRPAVAAKLAILDLSECDVGDAGVHDLASALPGLSHLKEFWLSKNNIGLEGAKALAEGLKGLVHLHTLVLSGNGISSEGVKSISVSIKALRLLAILGLGDNDIGDDGVKALTEGIKGLPKLSSLNLRANSVGDDGVTALSGVLSTLPALQTLNLKSNPIGTSGLKFVLECKPNFPRLTIYI